MTLKQRYKWLDWNVIAMVLVIKILLLVFGYQAFKLFNQESVTSLYKVFEIWKHWDAEHYLKLGQMGYTGTGDDRFLIVYFPLLPALISIFSVFTRDYLISAFLVSFIASLGLALAFKQLVKLDHTEGVSRYAVLFLFIFPTSYFLHIPYTESLFLALVVGSFLAARKRYWLAAGLLGLLAGLTRINGLILLPALAFEVWAEYRETKKINRNWFWLILVAGGFAGYLLLNYVVAGNPTIFMTYQREHWYKYLRLPYYGIIEAYNTAVTDKPEAALMRGFEELLFVAIGLFAIIAGWFRMRGSYRVWMIGNWLLFVSTSFVLSVPRYTLILFPIFILMAQIAVKNWTARILFVTWSLLFLGMFATQYVRGWWAF